MNESDKILKAEAFVKSNLKGYDSGHDWWHVERVRKMAAFINETEALEDPFIVDITALLHDTADSKFASENNSDGYGMIEQFMEINGMNNLKDRVLNVIKNISFSSRNNTEKPDDQLLWIVQDADRLDAIGAIGVARAFNYGGFRNNDIYNPDFSGKQKSTIGHFYEKLLLLKSMMNTPTAKKLAEERHEFLEIFLKQFYTEWNFNR
jgi:uncharacterized protein